jgi:hypothetical protein
MPVLKDAIMFVLNTRITPVVVDAVKAELTRKIPEVKSSHRCEAIARGLGFGTYASLLVAAKSPNPPVAKSVGAAFCGYLAAHGFVTFSKPFYHAVARAALNAVLKREPGLTKHGIGVVGAEIGEDGRPEKPKATRRRFDDERDFMTSDECVEQFLVSIAFLALVHPTKTIRSEFGAGTLKDIAENYKCTYPEGKTLGPRYVTTGALIAAATHMGFKMQSFFDENGHGQTFTCFNISTKSIRELDFEHNQESSLSSLRRLIVEEREYEKNQKQELRDYLARFKEWEKTLLAA